MTNCRSCGSSLEQSDRWCSNCGASAEDKINCPQCGHSNESSNNNCTECGTKLNTILETGIASSEEIGFIYEINQRNKAELEKSNAPIPYGAAAIFVENGKVIEIQKSGSFGKEVSDGLISSFLKAVNNFAKKIFKSKTTSSTENANQIYIVQDIKGLPIVKHNIPIQISGSPNASISIELFIDFDDSNIKENFGLFAQRFVKNGSMSFKELKDIAISNLPTLMDSYNADDFITENVRLDLSAKFLKLSGVSSLIGFQYGENLNRKQVEFSKLSELLNCSACGASIIEPSKFCIECGNDISNIDFDQGARYLLSSDGEQMRIKVTYVEDEFDSHIISESELSKQGFEILQNLIKNYSSEQILQSSNLQEISSKLNSQLTVALQNYARDFKVIDISTAQGDWLLNTDALLAEELRKVETSKKMLGVEGANIDLEEAAMALALRRVTLEDDQEFKLRVQRLKSRKQESEIEMEEHQLESDLRLKKRDIDNTEVAAEREDQLSQMEHEKSLEKDASLHDSEMADIVGDSRSKAKRRDVDDETYQEQERLRIEAERKSKLGNIDEDLKDREQERQLSKLEKMAELEANMAKQDMDFELQKTENMKGMTPQEILAMQAAQLAKSAGSDGVADVVKSIADSQAAASGADIKDELYQKMIDGQKEAMQSAIDAHKEVTDQALKSSEQFQKINEKSMESMSKVATEKSKNKNSQEKKDNKQNSCANCGQEFKGAMPKFCNGCGEPTS